MSTISLGLDFLWHFIEPILSDSIKERLKPKSSEAIAKERIFELYEVLGKVRNRTNEFIEKLKMYVKEVESGELAKSKEEFLRMLRESDAVKRGEIIPPPENSETALKKVASSLMDDLDELVSSLDRINPQLEIYESDIVKDLLGYKKARLQVIRTIRITTKDQELQSLILSAEKNRDLVDGAIERMQSFIRNEFSFKDSF